MKNATDKLTIVLAYADRYLYPILVLITLLKKNFLLTGIALIPIFELLSCGGKNELQSQRWNKTVGWQ